MEANIHEAKTHFSKLLARVAAGEEVIITNAGRPVARLVPVGALGNRRRLGMDAGKVVIHSDFDAPLPEDVIQDFER